MEVGKNIGGDVQNVDMNGSNQFIIDAMEMVAPYVQIELF
jgi:hypothetical protein